jgi:hypothetical protein
MRHTIILLILVLSAISFSVHGQSPADNPKKAERKARDRHLGVGIGMSYIRVMDQATSPLVYKGLQFPAAKLDYMVHSDRLIRTLEADFSYGALYARTETPWYDPSNTSYFVAIRFNTLWSLTRFLRGKGNWYLGPEININGHFRVNYKYGNSAFTFDNYNGIGVATRLELPFSWKAKTVKWWFVKFNRRDRDLRLSWQLSSPILSYMIRPTYVTITNFIDPDLQAKITSDHTTGGFFIPLNIRSQTELYYILQNRNMLKLSYIWNYFQHDPGYNKVQSAYHGFLFSFVIKFNPN